jgi:ABC-type phosphate transport system substrate-binding protein
MKKGEKKKMEKFKKRFLSVLILAMMAFSSMSIAISHAALNGSLVSDATLNIAGSSTVYPIAHEEASQFPDYWNALVAANPNWGAHTMTSAPIIAGEGSGTAIPALESNTADICEMSRPPTNKGDGKEWNSPAMSDMQIWAVGIDSVAIVVSPDMTWFPTDLTTQQVADLFAANPSTGGSAYSTYDDFFVAQGISTTGVPAAALSAHIHRAVRDLTSGTADCFNVYFGKPNGIDFLHKDGEVYDNLAPYTYCQENINIYNTVSPGTLGTDTEYIGFIAMGYLETYGNLIGLNIAFNMANPPHSLLNNDAKVWGTYVSPTRANVIWGYSGVQGSGATGQYMAWRWLWEVTPSTIPSTGPLLETGVWIAYMMKSNTTQNGASNFVNDQAYIELSRADMAGGQVLDSNLNAYTPVGGQTRTIPDGQVGYPDIVYFVDAYLHYYSSDQYNPYADINADGTIGYPDIVGFVNAYLWYFTNYNPTH